MKLTGTDILTTAGHVHADAQSAIASWTAIVRNADWSRPNDLKLVFPHASILSDHRVIFNIKGNSYRLVSRINYPARVVQVRWFGTHADYDKLKFS